MIKTFVILAIIFIVTVAIGYFFPFLSITNYIQYIPDKVTELWNWLQSYGVTPLQLIGALGGVTAVGGVVVAWLRAKLSATKQQADKQIYQTQEYATQQLKIQADTTKAALTQKEQEIADLQAQLTSSPTQRTITNLNEQITKLQSDYNTMERTYQNMIAKLKLEKQIVVK